MKLYPVTCVTAVHGNRFGNYFPL